MSGLYRTLTGQSQQSQQSHMTEASKQTPSLQKTTTTDPFSGVLNHLTDAQSHKLDQFKARLEKDGWWTREGINGKPSHDDGTLLRYLRARKFDIEGAYGQFTDTEKWMKEQHIEELYEHFDVDIYERARLMYPQWTGRRDRRGIPIYVYVIKGLDSKHIHKYQKESEAYKKSLPNHKKLSTPAKHLPLFALYHNLLNFILPFVSSLERPNPEIPVTNSTNIVDISNVGLTQFWNLKAHMQDASVLATAHYPETLDRIFIIGAPSFFPTVWGWVKRWFDPVTVSKIFILSKAEIKPTLNKFMDPENIPKRYGGQLDWEWGQLPSIDSETQAALERDGNKGWVAGPALWLDHKRVVVGSENGKARRSDKEIAELKPVVYAADWTEEPVHPERKASNASEKPRHPTHLAPPTSKLERIPSEHAVTAAKRASSDAQRASHDTPVVAAAAGVGMGAAATGTAVAAASHADKKQQPTQVPSDIKEENIKTAPSGDKVNMAPPPEQAAFPMQTAEYISEGKKEPVSNGEVKEPRAASQEPEPAVPVAAAAAAPPVLESKPTAPPESVANGTAYSQITQHPPGMTQPGPVPQHTVEVTKAVAHKMEGESISTLPAQANGALPHPEMIVSTDRSKGLALEADKVENLAATRPGMERFVTAAEF